MRGRAGRSCKPNQANEKRRDSGLTYSLTGEPVPVLCTYVA